MGHGESGRTCINPVGHGLGAIHSPGIGRHAGQLPGVGSDTELERSGAWAPWTGQAVRDLAVDHSQPSATPSRTEAFVTLSTSGNTQATLPGLVETIVLGENVYLRWEIDGRVQEDSLQFSKEGQRLEGTFVNSQGGWGSISGKRTAGCTP